MRVSWPFLATLSSLTSLCSWANAHSQRPAPLNYLSLVENPTISTPSHRVHSHSHFDLTFNLHRKKQRIKLTLEPNTNIIAEGASITHADADGNVIRSELIDRTQHKLFKGDAWVEEHDGSWTSTGWARITVVRDGVDPLFEGSFAVAHDSHHLKLRSTYLQTKDELDPDLEPGGDEYMVVFRDSDRAQLQHSELKRRDVDVDVGCRSNHMIFNSDPNHPIRVQKRDVSSWGTVSLSSLFEKRQIDNSGLPSSGNSAGVNLKNTIGSTNGCPTTRKVALIGVATDCSYAATFASTDAMRSNVLSQISQASAVYEKTFNITLGLKDIFTVDANCPGTPSTTAPWNVACGGNNTITTRLNQFSQWRGTKKDNYAYWTLLTNCPTGAEVGLAWLGQACVSDISQGSGETVSGANVVAKTPTEWQVIAHESGHTFGAVHDCNGQTCNDGTSVSAQQCCPRSTQTCDASAQFIMNPSTGRDISSFSPCTVGNICSAFLRNSVKSSCLQDNKGVVTVSGHQCGNGIVEDDEQCDCGGEANCGGNSCCDPKTCRFKNNAVCDDSNEECCKNCQYAAAATVCRKSTGECNPEERCTGKNATCPADINAPDGQSCSNGSLSCASGQCTSRDLQCKTLMGSYTSKNDTYACNSQDCSLSCASPEFGSGVCYSMQQNFLDGTGCGGGGTCSNGQCKGSSVIKEVGSWINDNKPLVIGLSAGVGSLLVLATLGCCIRRCRRPQRAAVRARKTASPPMQQRWPGPYANGWAAPPQPGAVGNYWQHQPPAVPARYSQQGYGGGGGAGGGNGHGSVRYA